MSTIPPEVRTGHPYHMYDAMCAQPEAAAACLERHRAAAVEVASAIAGRRRLVLAGIGTSFHAATVGEYLFRLLSDHRLDPRALQSFELVHYGRLGSDDALVVVSHRGTKGYSMQAVEAAKRAGAFCIAVTGLDHGGVMDQADIVLETVPQEASGAHTVSYTAAMLTLALIAVETARRGRTAPSVDLDALSQIPALQRAALALEPRCAELAHAHAGVQRFLLAGGGPNAATAWEIGLKMKEACYVDAEGLQVEQILHGPTTSFREESVVVAVAPTGPSQERAAAVLRAARAVAAPTVAVTTEGDTALAGEADATLALPPMAEALSPLVFVIPLQLYTYHSALARGANPDRLRVEEPAYARMRELYTL